MCNTNRSLGNSAKNKDISFQRYLTFITECSVTNQTLKGARNHRGGTKLEVNQSTNLSFSLCWCSSSPSARAVVWERDSLTPARARPILAPNSFAVLDETKTQTSWLARL